MKPGMTSPFRHGETVEIRYATVSGKTDCYDLQATILHELCFPIPDDTLIKLTMLSCEYI